MSIRTIAQSEGATTLELLYRAYKFSAKRSGTLTDEEKESLKRDRALVESDSTYRPAYLIQWMNRKKYR